MASSLSTVKYGWRTNESRDRSTDKHSELKSRLRDWKKPFIQMNQFAFCYKGSNLMAALVQRYWVSAYRRRLRASQPSMLPSVRVCICPGPSMLPSIWIRNSPPAMPPSIRIRACHPFMTPSIRTRVCHPSMPPSIHPCVYVYHRRKCGSRSKYEYA